MWLLLMDSVEFCPETEQFISPILARIHTINQPLGFALTTLVLNPIWIPLSPWPLDKTPRNFSLSLSLYLTRPCYSLFHSILSLSLLASCLLSFPRSLSFAPSILCVCVCFSLSSHLSLGFSSPVLLSHRWTLSWYPVLSRKDEAISCGSVECSRGRPSPSPLALQLLLTLPVFTWNEPRPFGSQASHTS